MSNKILFVDDEENILRAFERTLRSHYDFHTAAGPAQGLAALDERGPYAVVVSDLRMPGMDGIQFLAEVRKHSPDTVRLILSGNADLGAVIASVNEGSIFQFLTKPCPTDTIRRALDSALKQYQLITAERALLEETLNGTIGMLTEVLSLVNPIAFSRSARIGEYVSHMARRLELPNLWEFDLAAMLSQIGCIAVPSEVLVKHAAHQPLSKDEQEAINSHPSIGCGLIAKIPRLEVIAEIIRLQMKPYRELRNSGISEVVTVGAQMLKVALHFDDVVTRGETATSALKFMHARPETYQPSLVTAMETAQAQALDLTPRSVYLRELQPDMVVNEDIHAQNGLLLVVKGQALSAAWIARLSNFSKTVGVVEPFSVLVANGGQASACGPISIGPRPGAHERTLTGCVSQ